MELEHMECGLCKGAQSQCYPSCMCKDASHVFVRCRFQTGLKTRCLENPPDQVAQEPPANDGQRPPLFAQNLSKHLLQMLKSQSPSITYTRAIYSSQTSIPHHRCHRFETTSGRVPGVHRPCQLGRARGGRCGCPPPPDQSGRL